MRQLSQMAKIVSCIAAVDTGGAAKLGAHINMAKYNHVTFIIPAGAIGNDCVVTVLAAEDSVGTNGVAMAFNYRLASVGAALKSVVDGDLTNIAASGYTMLATGGDNKCLVIEVDADELVTPETLPYVGVNLANAAACLAACIAVCTEPTYQANAPRMPDPTVA